MALNLYGLKFAIPTFFLMADISHCIDKTMKSIERYSRKDALTWKKLYEQYTEAKDSLVSSINNPPLPLSSLLNGIKRTRKSCWSEA